MPYLLIFVICVAIECLYIPVARKSGIGTAGRGKVRPKNFTPAGGGMVFIIAALLCGLFYRGFNNPAFFTIFAGATVLACVSFIDDIYTIPAVTRLLIQFAVAATVLSSLVPDGHIDTYILGVVLVVGFINSFNFMDGINGMLCAYGLVSLGTLTYVLSTLESAGGLFPSLLQLNISLCIATVALSLFNFRRRAIVFSGDVGSITLGFFIIMTLSAIIYHTGTLSVLVFISVYVVDTSLTVMQRLFAGEHIMTPHRRHVYQLLTNRRQLSHLTVSTSYAALQLCINTIYLAVPDSLQGTVAIVATTLLIVLYFYLNVSPDLTNRRL